MVDRNKIYAAFDRLCGKYVPNRPSGIRERNSRICLEVSKMFGISYEEAEQYFNDFADLK